MRCNIDTLTIGPSSKSFGDPNEYVSWEVNSRRRTHAGTRTFRKRHCPSRRADFVEGAESRKLQLALDAATFKS
jgi:hypothetical protein